MEELIGSKIFLNLILISLKKINKIRKRIPFQYMITFINILIYKIQKRLINDENIN